MRVSCRLTRGVRSKLNSDELRQLHPVLIRPAKAEIFQASIDLDGNSDSSAGYFRGREFGPALSPSTSHTSALPNGRRRPDVVDRMNDA